MTRPGEPGHVSDSERFRPLHAAAHELVDELSSRYAVRVVTQWGDAVMPNGVRTEGSLRVLPADADAAPISVTFTAFPGITTRYGNWVNQAWPRCGCDDCDDDLADLVRQIRAEVHAVARGGLTEHLHVGLRPALTWALRHDDRPAHLPASQRSWGRIPRSRLDEHLQYGSPGRRNWSPWPTPRT